jgi:NTP pyrophosphatase (non-canonical NTP hydrolase)
VTLPIELTSTRQPIKARSRDEFKSLPTGVTRIAFGEGLMKKAARFGNLEGSISLPSKTKPVQAHRLTFHLARPPQSFLILRLSTNMADSLDSAIPLTIHDAQRIVDDWIKQYGVRYFSELTNLAQLVEEVGEVARIISRQYGEQSFKAGESNQQLGDELADVLFVLICLANQTGVDLQAALRKNLDKKTNRDAQRHQKNDKLKGKLLP